MKDVGSLQYLQKVEVLLGRLGSSHSEVLGHAHTQKRRGFDFLPSCSIDVQW